ncbi:MAG TPA: amino acid ABC transporter permease [Methylibium sp.]|uniref:amino acid ABC transporter permease n=1 Tax=Methylibium sp. TaxID=2067992 RepID=UPI002DBC5FBC|nr:amino acid ABC transporter permease [Methylibium sp.]HEU4460079.1 amino acid ABC transporter permease [Methylibium sp.]
MSDFFEVYGSYLHEWWPRLVGAVGVTIELSLLGFGLALVLGCLLGLMLRSKNRLVWAVANGFSEFLRAVPLLALLLALYFGLPSFGLTLSGYWAGILGLGLQGAAYVAEVLSGGLTAVHKGQREAGLATGMHPLQVFGWIVLPQAMRVMLPPLLNCYVALLKDSSLCALIATDELMLTARAMASEYFLPLHIFLLVGLFYFAAAFPLSMLSRALSRRLARGRQAVGVS